MKRAVALALALGSAAGCGGGNPTPVEYQQNRWDYYRFEERVGALPTPNYLPWAMHREVAGRDEILVACRWPDAAFPLKYAVNAPEIPEALEGESVARSAADYVAAVDEAFASWQKAIGPPVRFERTANAAEATLTIELLVKIEEVPQGQVLGVVRGEADRCSVKGSGATPDRVEIAFAPNEATLYIADPMGLLTPRQVRAVALHEIGHLLGVSGQHSPLAGDVMYEVAGDRRIEALSEHDKNTLRALYRLRREMRRLAEGEKVAPIHFRDGDFWIEFAEEFNAVARRMEMLDSKENEPSNLLLNGSDDFEHPAELVADAS
jgi:predicted Zn-dependent protease